MSVLRMVGRVGAGLAMVAGAGAGFGQATSSFGNGLSAAAIARGGTLTAERSGPLDAMQGNAAALVGVDAKALDVTGVGVFAQGSFRNKANANGRLSGLAGALPYGAFAMPLGEKWVGAVAFTPELALKANWRYFDAPGTAGATYGLQEQETQIIAVTTSVGAARKLGNRWSVGGDAGVGLQHERSSCSLYLSAAAAVGGVEGVAGAEYAWGGGERERGGAVAAE